MYNPFKAPITVNRRKETALNRLKYIIAASVITVLLCGTASGEMHSGRGYDSIDPLKVYGYCRELASPKYEGRLTGHEGYTASAQWAADRFAEWGLKPVAGADGYLVPFTCPYTIVNSAAMTLIGSEGKSIELTVLEDFMPMLYTDGGEVESGLVFAGWGIHAPELEYDDYAGIDVSGRFVICFRGTPDRSEEGYNEHDHHRKRMETASSMGAAGLFYIYDEPMANPNGDLIESFMCGMLSDETADSILASHGTTSARLKKGLREEKRPNSFELGWKASFSAEVEHFPEGIGYNAAAVLEGSDPELRDECVIIGGHLDHCGRHMGMVFNGAQDNASGSAVVMGIAEAFSMLGKRPARTVVFVLFGAEEMGLLGSYSFAEHATAHYRSIDAMFNFDMVGEGDGINCGVTVDPEGLKDLVLQADETVGTLGRTWDIKNVGVRSSDYAPFFLKGAACAAMFSNGPHLHYHKPGDTIYRINPDMLADAARLGFLAALMRSDR